MDFLPKLYQKIWGDCGFLKDLPCGQWFLSVRGVVCSLSFLFGFWFLRGFSFWFWGFFHRIESYSGCSLTSQHEGAGLLSKIFYFSLKNRVGKVGRSKDKLQNKACNSRSCVGNVILESITLAFLVNLYLRQQV